MNPRLQQVFSVRPILYPTVTLSSHAKVNVCAQDPKSINACTDLRARCHRRLDQFLVSSDVTSGDALEREMYLLRRVAAKNLVDRGLSWQEDMYFCSLSTRTIVYKGMTNANVREVGWRRLIVPSCVIVHEFVVFGGRGGGRRRRRIIHHSTWGCANFALPPPWEGADEELLLEACNFSVRAYDYARWVA